MNGDGSGGRTLLRTSLFPPAPAKLFIVYRMEKGQ